MYMLGDPTLSYTLYGIYTNNMLFYYMYTVYMYLLGDHMYMYTVCIGDPTLSYGI